MNLEDKETGSCSNGLSSRGSPPLLRDTCLFGGGTHSVLCVFHEWAKTNQSEDFWDSRKNLTVYAFSHERKTFGEALDTCIDPQIRALFDNKIESGPELTLVGEMFPFGSVEGEKAKEFIVGGRNRHILREIKKTWVIQGGLVLQGLPIVINT